MIKTQVSLLEEENKRYVNQMNEQSNEIRRSRQASQDLQNTIHNLSVTE